MTISTSARNSLRRFNLLLAVVLLVQFGLGMIVNIYVTLPKNFQGAGLGESFGNAMSKGPASLAMHTGVGLLLLVLAVGLLVHALMAGHRVVLIGSVVALVAIVGAAFSGANFVNTSQNSATLTMALLTVLALLCTVVNLYVLGAPAQAQAQAVETAASASSAEPDSLV